MRYLLDINFISELRKEHRANRGVLAWGLAQAIAIEKWLGEQIIFCSNKCFGVTVSIADRWVRLISQTRLAPQDLLLAATALQHDLTVITRNVMDFESSGARVYNPWK